MKKVLCISPHFPPINAADMHRLRQSLPYFQQFGWIPVIFHVQAEHIEQAQDPLLLQSLPENIETHALPAYPSKLTRKIGLGNLGFRSYLQFRKHIDHYLKHHKVDLIYFSTTVFTLMALGVHWKKKFNVPFIIDLQDPWRNDYYLSIPKADRHPKFWFDYRQKKTLEAYTLPKCDGIIAVSEGYINTAKQRYPILSKLHCLTLPFAALQKDIDIARSLNPVFTKKTDQINITYIGRGGKDMTFSLKNIFKAFALGLKKNPNIFSTIHFHFIGTSYAANGKGIKTIQPIAQQYEVAQYVNETTDRLPYFKSLKALCDSDILLIPGSTDSDYTASKLFPYILTEVPILAVFNQQSSVVNILKDTQAGEVVSFNEQKDTEQLPLNILNTLENMLHKIPYKPDTRWDKFKPFSAQSMTKKQCDYFDHVLAKRKIARDL